MAEKQSYADGELVCEVCGKKTDLRRCSRCKQVLYCSREHQVQHWKFHKNICRKNDVKEILHQKRKAEQEELDDFNTRTAMKSGTDTIGTSKPKYDTRPLKLLSVPCLTSKSQDFEFLGQFITKELDEKGYCVIDGLLKDELCHHVLEDIKKLDSKGVMKQGMLAGGRTSGNDDEKVTKADIRSDIIGWLQGTEKEDFPYICSAVSQMDDLVSYFNKHLKGNLFIAGRTKAMAACYPGNGAYYMQHVDNPCKDGRLITCILYLNKDWNSEKYGGVLRLFPEGSGDYVDVAPLMNRMLFFWSDRRNPHEVRPAFKNRYALTVWYFDQEERQQAKSEYAHAQKDINKLNQRVAQVQVSVKEVEVSNLEQKIHNEADNAVAGLSKDEIEALSVLVAGQANPREFLTSLGIASSIQDSLLQLIHHQKNT